jgi:hypothetical protein
LSPEDKALYERITASGDPTTVTLAERHHINQLLPPDEEDRMCREKTGLALAELKSKALTNFTTLSEVETNILLHSTTYDSLSHPPTSARSMLWYTRLALEERELIKKVKDLILNLQELEVVRLALRRSEVFDDIRKKRSEERRKKQRGLQAKKINALRAKLVDEMIDAKLGLLGSTITFGFRIWRGLNLVYGSIGQEIFYVE